MTFHRSRDLILKDYTRYWMQNVILLVLVFLLIYSLYFLVTIVNWNHQIILWILFIPTRIMACGTQESTLFGTKDQSQILKWFTIGKAFRKVLLWRTIKKGYKKINKQVVGQRKYLTENNLPDNLCVAVTTNLEQNTINDSRFNKVIEETHSKDFSDMCVKILFIHAVTMHKYYSRWWKRRLTSLWPTSKITYWLSCDDPWKSGWVKFNGQWINVYFHGIKVEGPSKDYRMQQHWWILC